MTLYILRHAQAGEHVAGAADDLRHLTADGRRRMRQAVSGMRHLGLRLDALITSPLPRAAETAALVAQSYRSCPRPQVMKALACRVPAADAVAALTPFAAQNNVMIVGHEPQLRTIASILLTGLSDSLRIQLKKGGCLVLDFPSGAEPGRGELLWIMTQRQLGMLSK